VHNNIEHVTISRMDSNEWYIVVRKFQTHLYIINAVVSCVAVEPCLFAEPLHNNGSFIVPYFVVVF
jgi:hypothetical protein